jgi:hypothetical protein
VSIVPRLATMSHMNCISQGRMANLWRVINVSLPYVIVLTTSPGKNMYRLPTIASDFKLLLDKNRKKFLEPSLNWIQSHKIII